MNSLSNNKTLEEMSLGPGMYRLNDSKLRNKISYPWSPTVQLQKVGGSVMDQNFIDVSSELKNLTRPLSNNPYKQYIPGKEDQSYSMIHFDDGFFEQNNTRLTNNSFELKGVGINRWQPLFFDPQKNCIEPFERRNGVNTVLNTLDKHVKDC
tara:strand:+ start:106 stop:561 length:456 start_codon:yes stop_codon:yes gene_type:complete